MRNVTLILDDGSRFHGKSFGYEKPVAGEVVFNTAMTGYPESLTDPSYAGQLMTLTYPLVGNYGVPPFTFESNGLATFMESERIHAEAIIVSDYSEEYSHWNAVESLADWLKREQVPGITGIDTRELTKVLREHGVMMGKIVFDGEQLTVDSGQLTVDNGQLTVAMQHDSAANCQLSTVHCQLNKQVYILRPCMIHGAGNKGNLNLLYNVVKKGIPWPLGAFENRRSFTSIDNLCYVVEGLLTKDVPGGIYHMGGDEAMSTNELITIICEVMGKKSRIWKINRGIMEGCAGIGTLFHLPLNTERLRKLTENYVVSNAKIKRALGIDKMPVTAKEGLIKTIRSFE